MEATKTVSDETLKARTAQLTCPACHAGDALFTFVRPRSYQRVGAKCGRCDYRQSSPVRFTA